MTDDTVSLSSYKDLSQSSSLGDNPPSSSTSSNSETQQVRLELERSQNQVKDLEMARSSLRSEVDKLKSLLDAAADSISGGSDYDTATEAATVSAEAGLESMTKTQLVAKIHRLNSVMLATYKNSSSSSSCEDESDSSSLQETAREAQAQKEIIIARDLAIEKLTKEGEAARAKVAQLEQQHQDLTKVKIVIGSRPITQKICDAALTYLYYKMSTGAFRC